MATGSGYWLTQPPRPATWHRTGGDRSDGIPCCNCGWKGDRTDETPQRRLETTETDSLFTKTMAQLPYNWRTVLQMRNVEDMSFTEIAAITGMTESSVRGTLSKARKRMIELINKQR